MRVTRGQTGLFHEQTANANIKRKQLWGAPGCAGEVNVGSIQGSRAAWMSSASQVKSGAVLWGLMEDTLP